MMILLSVLSGFYWMPHVDRMSCLTDRLGADIAGVIIFRNTPIALEFLAEWRDWLTNPEHETATVGEHARAIYATCEPRICLD